MLTVYISYWEEKSIRPLVTNIAQWILLVFEWVDERNVYSRCKEPAPKLVGPHGEAALVGSLINSDRDMAELLETAFFPGRMGSSFFWIFFRKKNVKVLLCASRRWKIVNPLVVINAESSSNCLENINWLNFTQHVLARAHKVHLP